MNFIHELGKAFLPSSDAYIFMWILATVGISAAAVAVERWLQVRKRTDYDTVSFFDKICELVHGKQIDEAYEICASGGSRALPRILACGLRSFKESPELVAGAMAEESTYMAAAMERRLNYLVMFGNVSTLFGLLGTVFGLIMSFDAVSQPNVAAVEKSALLAAGISTAMNATLVGLSISVLSVMVYAFLRARVDAATAEIDRYAVAIMNILNPPNLMQQSLKSLVHRSGEEEHADADVTPMLNLMVLLIPVLLTSSEFVKMGAIELKLPEAGGGGGGGANEQVQEIKLDLGVVIRANGFGLFDYFKAEEAKASGATAPALDADGKPAADIRLKDGKYDYETLNQKLAEVKKRALLLLLRQNGLAASEASSLAELYRTYAATDLSANKTFPDNESVKIVAEEKIKYETVIAVMDAARGIRTSEGNVTLFPNVSIAGGIIQ